LQSPAIRANTCLWFDGEELLAFTFVDNFDNIFFDCLPDQLNLLGGEIVEWGVSRLGSEANTLDASCRENDIARVVFLERHGFVRTPIETMFMRRDLDAPIPNPVLPEGFVIRSLRGEEEAGAAAELHRLAFGTDYITTEVRLTWMRVPGYDPSLDLVATAPDGTFAAYCVCSIDHEQNQKTGRLEGQTDPVATHPHYQKLGLARALLLTGMNLLEERGMKTARLGTSSENVPMQKAAQSVGFYVDYKKIWFEKAKK
jgi:ribosomal protein S18 acetylase RimI-like enzyme